MKLNTSNTLIIIIMIIIYLFKNYIYVWKRFREKEYLIKMLRRIKKKIVGSKLIFSLKFKNAQSIFITFFFNVSIIDKSIVSFYLGAEFILRYKSFDSIFLE